MSSKDVILIEAPAAWGTWAQLVGRTHRRPSYGEREVQMCVENLRAGHEPRHLLHSPVVVLEATQRLRAEQPSWGERFRKDPRRFSSTPRLASAETVAAFIDGVRIQ